MGISIAIVDDDESILDSIQLTLEGHGWVIETYSTGEEFVQNLDRREWSCIILDPHLPGISGAQVARLIFEHEPKTPVIGLTAWPTAALTSEVEDAGVPLMLKKPVSADELVEIVVSAVETRTSFRS